MKKVMKKFKQTLSILLAVAMVITLVPETGFSVSAAELETIAEDVETDVTADAPTVEESIVEESTVVDEPSVDGTEIPEESSSEPESEPVSVPEESTQESESQSESDDALNSESDVPNEGDTTAHNVTFVKEDTQVTVTGDATTTAGSAYTFTAVANEGYENVTVKAYIGYTDAENTGTEVSVASASENTYTIADADITADITIVVTATAVTAVTGPKVTITTDETAAGVVTAIQYAIGEATEFVPYTEAVAVTSGATLKFKFTADPDYTVTVKNGETPLTPADDVYTVENITADTTITITAVKTKYEVTTTISKDTDGNDEAEIEYVNECVTTAEGKSTIEAGVDLSFKVKVKDALKNDKKIDSVKYTIGEGTEEKTLEADEDGVYTISKDEIKGKVVINVATAEYTKYTVEFTYDAEKVKAPEVVIGEEAAKTDTDGKYLVSENVEDAAFALVMNEGFAAYRVKAITKIYADGTKEAITELNANNSYILGKLKGNVTVDIQLELDPEKANVLNFSVDGHKTSYTATVSGNDINVPATDVSGNAITVSANDVIVEEGLEGTSYQAGDQLVTLSKSVALYIAAEKGYQIDKVELGGEEIQPAGNSSYYNVALDGKKELKVTTSPLQLEASKKVVFANRSGKMTYTVETGASVTKVPNTSNNYEIGAGATYFNFTVTSTNAAYKPLVYLSGDEDPIAGEKGTATKKGTPYTFSIAANLLPDDAVIYIDEEAVMQQVVVDYNADEVVVNARVGAKAIESVPNEDGDFVYEVVNGQTLTVVVTPLDNCQITAATTKVGDAAAKAVKLNAAGEIAIKVTDDTTVTVTSKGLYKPSLTTVSGNDIAPVKNVYTVDYDGQYVASVTVGVNTPVHITKVDAKIGNVSVEGADLDKLVKINTDDDTKVAITPDAVADIAGKKVTVNLYANNKDNEEEKVATYTLNVLPVITKASVAGVDKNGVLSQTIDTTKEYKITLTPKTANLNAVKAESSDPAVKAEVTEDGMLKITTGQTAGDQVATVKLYTGEEENKTYLKKDATNNLAITVKATAMLTEAVKPTLKLKSSDDVSLTLTLGAPKTLVVPNTGDVYYKVEVTPRDVANAPQSIKDATAEPTYIKKTDAASQDAKIRVNTVLGNDAAGNAVGGEAWSFDVKVTLIQTNDQAGISQDTEAAKTLAIGGSVSSPANKPFATKDPYYETNLKLKKGTTTVYTTQENVTIATPVFGKNTTFTDVTVKDITDGLYSDGKLTVTADNEHGVILASATSRTVLGKHTIEVTADAANQMYAAKATIVINVVRGIEQLDISLPSASIYKADKKAASLKATPVYNNGATSKDRAAKTKKVKDWKIVPVDENNTYLESMVTVKNGTISVNKNYVVSSDEEANQFYVTATAADFNGHTKTARSKVITITSEAIEIGEVVIAEYDYENGNYKVIARNAGSVEASEIQGAHVVALRKGTPETATFESADMINFADLSFSSSNKKAVVVDAKTGEIVVLKPAKKVTLTVTANDGSKNKASMKFDVKYAEVADLAIMLMPTNPIMASWEDGSPITEGGPLAFKGTTNTGFGLQVVKTDVAGENAQWEELDDYTDFTVSVKGAKVVFKDGDYNASELVVFVANTENATIKLASKSLGIEKTYTLTNASFASAKAPKVNIPNAVANSFEEQMITGRITNLQDVDITDKYIQIDLDYTAALNAKNAEGYMRLEDACQASLNTYQKLNADGSFNLYMEEGRRPLIAGSYKLKVTVGTVNEQGVFIPDTKTGSATLKVVAPKVVKGSFSPTLKYTISARDTREVELTGKGKNFANVTFSNLQSANVRGAENKFREYFELKDNKLSLKDDLTAEEIAEIKKDDLTAYVDYDVDLGSDAYGYPKHESRTVKITITLKDTAVVKYAAGNVTFLAASGNDISGNTVSGNMASVSVSGNSSKVTVTANKKEISVAYAYTDDTNFEVACVDGALLILPKKDSTLNVKAYKNVPIYIIPKGSYFEKAVAEAADEEAKNKAIKDNGVLVKTTVTVKLVDAKNAKPKTTIAKKELTKTFTASQYATVTQNYWVEVPYTQANPSKISEIESSVPYVHFEADQDNIYVHVYKDELKEADAYGKKNVPVTATISYKWDQQADESFTFKLTMPAEEGKSFTETADTVSGNVPVIEKAAVRSYPSSTLSNEAEAAFVRQMKEAVETEVRKLVSEDSDTDVKVMDVNMYDSDVYTRPTKTTEGKLKITVVLRDTHDSNASPRTIEFNLIIPAIQK